MKEAVEIVEKITNVQAVSLLKQLNRNLYTAVPHKEVQANLAKELEEIDPGCPNVIKSGLFASASALFSLCNQDLSERDMKKMQPEHLKILLLQVLMVIQAFQQNQKRIAHHWRRCSGASGRQFP